MPNIKIFVDHALLAARGDQIGAMLPTLRAAACRELTVPPDACQLAVIGVMGLPDQPQVNVEYQYLGLPGRDRARIEQTSGVFRRIVAEAAGAHTAVRADRLDAASYVALK